MENHLLIGLGGTGGRVLAAFRKLMYERFNGEVKPKDLWLDYLYVDSSEQDLKMDEGSCTMECYGQQHSSRCRQHREDTGC